MRGNGITKKAGNGIGRRTTEARLLLPDTITRWCSPGTLIVTFSPRLSRTLRVRVLGGGGWKGLINTNAQRQAMQYLATSITSLILRLFANIHLGPRISFPKLHILKFY